MEEDELCKVQKENIRVKNMFLRNNYDNYDLFEHNNISSRFNMIVEDIENNILKSYFINSQELFIDNLIFIDFQSLSKEYNNKL